LTPRAPVEIQSPSTLLGPGGTQQVVVGRSLDHLAERKPDRVEDLRGGNLPSHPAGSYLPPAIRASLARSAADPVARVPGPAPVPSGLPQAFDDASSSQPGDADVKTQLYRPAEDAAQKPRVDTQPRGGGAGATVAMVGPAKTGSPVGAAAPTGAPVGVPARTGAPVTTGSPGGAPVPRPPADSLAVAPAKPGVPLVLVLLGFLLVGFVVVAGVMVIFKH
jgi:hypothetical protein